MSKHKNIKVEIDGIKFDSKIEAKYYSHLLERANDGEIGHFIIQPRYLLQESFKKNGKHFRKIEYVADFEVINLDGTIEVIDIKGQIMPVFALKKKLFERLYPDYSLKLLTHVAKWGGWVTLDELKRLRKVKK